MKIESPTSFSLYFSYFSKTYFSYNLRSQRPLFVLVFCLHYGPLGLLGELREFSQLTGRTRGTKPIVQFQERPLGGCYIFEEKSGTVRVPPPNLGNTTTSGNTRFCDTSPSSQHATTATDI